MIKISFKKKNNSASLKKPNMLVEYEYPLEEASKWRNTDHSPAWTEEGLKEIESSYDTNYLYVHFDDGVNVDGDRDPDDSKGLRRLDYKTKSNGITVPARFQPQFSFNPQTKYSTPIGVYMYPWSYAREKIISGGLPFAQDKHFMYVFAAKDPSKVLLLRDAHERGVFEKTLALVRDKFKSSARDIRSALKSSGCGYNESAQLVDKMFDSGEQKDINTLTKELMPIVKHVEETKKEPLFEEDDESDLENLAKDKDQELYENIKYFLLQLRLELQKYEQITDDALAVSIRSIIHKLKGDFSGLIFDSSFEEDLIFQYLKENLNSTEKTPNNFIPKLEDIYKVISGENSQVYALRWFYFINNIFEKEQSKVTHFYQNSLGIGILVDSEGWGIIHSFEPTQGIIFSPAYAKLVDVKINPKTQDDRYLQNRSSAINKKSDFERMKKRLESTVESFESSSPEQIKDLLLYQAKHPTEYTPMLLKYISRSEEEKILSTLEIIFSDEQNLFFARKIDTTNFIKYINAKDKEKGIELKKTIKKYKVIPELGDLVEVKDDNGEKEEAIVVKKNHEIKYEPIQYIVKKKDGKNYSVFEQNIVLKLKAADIPKDNELNISTIIEEKKKQLDNLIKDLFLSEYDDTSDKKSYVSDIKSSDVVEDLINVSLRNNYNSDEEIITGLEGHYSQSFKQLDAIDNPYIKKLNKQLRTHLNIFIRAFNASDEDLYYDKANSNIRNLFYFILRNKRRFLKKISESRLFYRDGKNFKLLR